MSHHKFENPFRKAYEWDSMTAWMIGALALLLIAITHGAPWLLHVLGLLMLLLGLWEWRRALYLEKRIKRLEGRPLSFGTLTELQARIAAKPDSIWLGTGFEWGQEQAQDVSHLKRSRPDLLKSIQDTRKGQPWIHGIRKKEKEEDIYLPIDHARGHTLILGTTGSGKTRLLENLIAQAILRDEVVIIIDPKGDKELRTTAEAVCMAQGRPDRFVMFHKAFPAESIRLDPMRNFANSAQLATRIATLVARDRSIDVFSGFCQKTLMVIAEGMQLIGMKPSLRAFLQYVEGGIDALLIGTLEWHFDAIGAPHWRASVAEARGRAMSRPGMLPEQAVAKALVQYYRDHVYDVPGMRSPAVDGLIGQFEHDRTHAQKLLVSLAPILHMLTTGTLGDMLSPDETNETDHRPILDSRRIIDRRMVLYIGLDSLSDPMVGAAMGSLLLADLANLAGDIYNYQSRPTPISCFIDEAAECISDPTIALLNKGRGAGFSMTILTQTFSDFVAAVGSEAKARQILGNTNNQICQRVKDGETQRYVSENVPETVIRWVTRSQGSSNSSTSPTGFTGSVSQTLTEETVSLIDPADLGGLPDLEFFANISGGRVFKVATPILKMESTHEPSN